MSCQSHFEDLHYALEHPGSFVEIARASWISCKQHHLQMCIHCPFWHLFQRVISFQGYLFKPVVVLLRVCHPQQDSQKLQKKLNCHTTCCGCTVRLTESLGSKQKTAVIPLQCTMDNRSKINQNCPQQVFHMMPENLISNDDLYALQWTTFIMQMLKILARVGVLGKKGKKRQNQNKPRTLYEKHW